MFARVWRWMNTESDEKWRRMPKTWLSNTARMASYVDWTARENDSGIVTKGTQFFLNAAFWEAQDAKQQVKQARERQFQKKAS